MLTRAGGRPLDRAWSAAETRRRRRLDHAVLFDKGRALAIMRMARRLFHAEHGREANVATLHDAAPFVARLGAEQLRDPLLHRGPRFAVELPGQFLALEPREPQQLLVELRFDRADTNVFAVAGLVGVVEVCSRVEHVLTAIVGEHSRSAHAVDRGHQGRDAIDHGRIYYLSLARLLRLQQPRDYAQRQVKRATTEISDEIEGRHRRLALAPNRMQRSGQCDVVDVVAGGMR